MKFYSTNNTSRQVSFKEAVFNSMPQDRGLYMPVQIPRLDDKFLNNLDGYTLPEIAFHVAQNLLGDDIPEAEQKTNKQNTNKKKTPKKTQKKNKTEKQKTNKQNTNKKKTQQKNQKKRKTPILNIFTY